ncbi:MAG: S1 family peptidase, partial [Clostridia bacterium]|nr:S1 family peptidase [Clostridia bacterium]
LAHGENITQLLRTLPTDITEVGTIRFQGFAMSPHPCKTNQSFNTRQNKMRPAVPGISIGHHKITAGTLGAVVYGDFPQGIALLSNNHVLANCSTGQDKLAQVGDPIWQPGPYDGGSKNDLLAQLIDFMPYHCVTREEYQQGDRPAPNYMDAALALPLDKNQIKNQILGLGQPTGTLDPTPGMIVLKSGRTTGLTNGKIITIHNT